MTRLPMINRIRALLGESHRRSVLQLRQTFMELARDACRESQREVLQDLLRLNTGTRFAADFGLYPGMSLEEYRQRVPVGGYDLVQPYVERLTQGDTQALLGSKNRLLMFAVTSGTTSESKLIPVTNRFLRDYRRGWQAWGIGAYYKHVRLQKLNIVQIISSHRRFLSPAGIPCGNISGLVASMQGAIVRSMYSVPAEIAEIPDPAAKRYAVVRCAVSDPFVGMIITANPSTVLQMTDVITQNTERLIHDIRTGEISSTEIPTPLLKRLRKRFRPNPARAMQLHDQLKKHGSLSPKEIWPELAALGVWCGGSAAAYIPELRTLFPGIAIRDHGLHASEGRMTMPLEDESSAGVLEISTHFFEFMPVAEELSSNPVTLEAHELQEGQEYFILLTTSSGLCRYNIQDVVRCVGFYGSTPLLEFRHKGAHISSITGEKLAESQVVEAVQAAAADLQVSLRRFTLTPEWADPPGYTLFVELGDHGIIRGDNNMYLSSEHQIRLNELAEAVDQMLAANNVEYREKRESGRLRPARCEFLSRDAWQRFHASRTQRLGGSLEQYKHPCLLPDPRFENLLRRFAD